MLLQWATRWHQVLDCCSDDELAELLCGAADADALPMWDFVVKQWKQDMDEFQEFARQAMADGVLLTMRLV